MAAIQGSVLDKRLGRGWVLIISAAGRAFLRLPEDWIRVGDSFTATFPQAKKGSSRSATNVACIAPRLMSVELKIGLVFCVCFVRTHIRSSRLGKYLPGTCFSDILFKH